MYRRIRDIREDHDLKQKDLARVLGCSQQVYSDYERGTRRISADDLVTLARFYHVSVDYLLGMTDEKKPYPPAKENKILDME